MFKYRTLVSFKSKRWLFVPASPACQRMNLRSLCFAIEISGISSLVLTRFIFITETSQRVVKSRFVSFLLGLPVLCVYVCVCVCQVLERSPSMIEIWDDMQGRFVLSMLGGGGIKEHGRVLWLWLDVKYFKTCLCDLYPANEDLAWALRMGGNGNTLEINYGVMLGDLVKDVNQAISYKHCKRERERC